MKPLLGAVAMVVVMRERFGDVIQQLNTFIATPAIPGRVSANPTSAVVSSAVNYASEVRNTIL
jgi:hypothetical protein